MKKISQLLHAISTEWVTLLALVIFLIFIATILPRQALKVEETSGGAESPDTSFFYSTDDLYKMADTYGEAGRMAYIRTRFSFDTIFPLVYTAFLCTSISWITQRAFPHHSRWQYTNLVPILGMGFDFLENISTSLVMARFPAKTPVVDWLAPVLSLVKWIFVNGSFILLFISILIALLGWAKRKITDNPTRNQQ